MSGMRLRKGIGMLASATALLALGSCSNAAVVRYRVTVAVRTPQGVRSGSSVWEWRLSRPTVALATAYDGKFRGEAVAVDVAPGQTLFALIRGEDGSTSYAELLPEWTFGDTARSLRGERRVHGSDRVNDLRDVASRVGERVTLSCGGKPGCPMLVTFTNIADPKSVTRVDPNNLTASFGQGYALDAITVEVTRDK